jgi:C1A family cysteine protease
MNTEKARAMAICVVIVAVSAFTAVAAMPVIASETSNTIEIEELQQRVYDKGYNYTIAKNWITRLSPEDRGALCGFKPLKAPEETPAGNVRFFSDVPKAKAETKKFRQPLSYDAMELGYVTPVKNQGECGSCWIFGATADFESDVAKGESTLLDFSEQEVGDCNVWSRVGGYDFCDGGNSFMTTNYFTKYGSADETCHPYAATPETCQNCTVHKNVNNWRIITGVDGESQINTIKNAILTYGPVYSTIYASDPEFHAYSGGVYENWTPGGTNHAIEIIGWNDSLTHSHGAGAWLIKNSWGTGWGASGPYPGCAWVAYGAANLGDYTSAIAGYTDPKPNDVIFYHDECGWMGWCWGYGGPTAYGAVRFEPLQDSTLTAVDFWAVAPNMQYEIKIFDTLNIVGSKYNFTNPLGNTKTGTTDEFGYYSIPLDTPVQLVTGNDFIVQVNLTTTTGWGYPIPIDYYPDLNWSAISTSSGESYTSRDGFEFGKFDAFDIGIRARTRKATISVKTDKFKYCPSDNMTLTINVSNPISSPVTFKWYFGIARFGYWLHIYTGTLPAGYENTVAVPIPVGDWGSTPFSFVWYVNLEDLETGQVLDADSVSCAYCNCSRYGEEAVAMSTPTLSDITKKIGEEIGGVA